MFDAETEKLIKNAPALEGLDLAALPKEFTRIYASIVASRMRLRGILSQDDMTDGATPNLPDSSRQAIRREMSFLSELASTQEALISVSPNRADRKSAAFVAGTSHYVLLQARRLITGAEAPHRLDSSSIPPEVSATLLFLIAGASADASQMSREISGLEQDETGIQGRLLTDIRRFAIGQLTKIESPGAFVANPDDSSLAETACDALYHLIHVNLHLFAQVMLGELDSAQIAAEFARIEALAVSSTPTGQVFSFYSVFAGPRHLAALFKSLAQDFPEGSVANIPVPSGCDPARWTAGVKKIARNRPYLWQNHLDAIRKGYLNVGVSSAISFPTGAGKSTLSELKILSTLCSNLKVVFLAPTLSLVDQTARALDVTFPEAKIEREHASDDPFGYEDDSLPAITVMTPERCLTLMGFEPTLFRSVGLVVFDECHLLHANNPERGTRAVDSMLCVLNAIQFAPKADMLLLSAMMSNSADIAGWLKSITNRQCLSLSMSWKPTRQVRGCLVYAASEINILKAEASDAKDISSTVLPPKVFQNTLLANPQGFFGLKQTWDSLAREDYALMPLLDETVPLALNKYWQLTPNANQVASAIAAAAIGEKSRRPLKTLIFCQTTVNANSAAEYVRERVGKYSVKLTQHETALYKLALEEMGAENSLFVELLEGQNCTSSALPHHARLLPSERHLHESLYKRHDGIHVLAATSTLAQGMNLPSQVVVIAGDSRFDKGANKLERLEAHELLNAAGRAGRAGENSYGFVLVIPSKVVHFSDAENLIHSHWSELQGIFSQSDQCLAIEDPLEELLDQIHAAGHAATESSEYFLRRLPMGSDTNDLDGPAKVLLSRTFNAYKHNRAGDSDWVSSRILSALNARKTLAGPQDEIDWADHLGAKFGVEPTTLRALQQHFSIAPHEDSIPGWISWLFTWFRKNANIFPDLVRKEGLETLFGKPYRTLTDSSEKGFYALERLEPLMMTWIAGGTLHEIECKFGTSSMKTKKCDNARDFVLRIVPDLAYLASLPELIRKECGDLSGFSSNFSLLSQCVREGLDTVEKLALFNLRSKTGERVACHRRWIEISKWVSSPDVGEDWPKLYQRVKLGMWAAEIEI